MNQYTNTAASPPSLGLRLKSCISRVYCQCGYVALRDAIRALFGRGRIVVVYYHRIGGKDPLSVTPQRFAQDLDYLQAHYRCMGLFQALALLKSGAAIRRRIAVITFDDGYRDNFTAALPLLRERQMTATFFVATGFISADKEFPHDLRNGPAKYPKLTWDDLRAMTEAGMEIGSHTVNHTNIAQASPEQAQVELTESLRRLNEQLSSQPRPFSFPWGKPGDYTDAWIGQVRASGYYAACTAYGGHNRRGLPAEEIRRVDVGNGAFSQWIFRARVAGLDPDYRRHRRRLLSGS